MVIRGIFSLKEDLTLDKARRRAKKKTKKKAKTEAGKMATL